MFVRTKGILQICPGCRGYTLNPTFLTNPGAYEQDTVSGLQGLTSWRVGGLALCL